MIGLREKITSRTRRLTEDDLVRLHHEFMLVYGWIPTEEFRSLSLPTLWNLVPLVKEEVNKRENLRLCLLKFVGVKNPE